MRRWIRVRALLDRWFAVLVVVCLLVTLAGGWLAYQGHVDPGTTTEQRIVSSWSTEGTISHSATVRSENPAYPVGTTLRGRAIYFSDVAPVLNGTVAFTYSASDSGNLAVEITTEKVLRSVTETGNRRIEVWRQTEQIGNRSIDSLNPGSTVTSQFSVNVSRIQKETERLDEGLGNPPGENRMSVQTTVELTGTVNDQRVNRSETYELRLEFEEGGYRPVANASAERYETTRLFEVPREPGPLQLVGGPLLAGLGVLGLVGLVTARTRNQLALTDVERARLEFEDDRSDYDEWITTFDLPTHIHDMPRANAESLSDLVNFAIDTNNSVIENPNKEAYYVIHNGYCYTYELPREGIEAETPLQGDGHTPTGEDENEAVPTDD